MFAALAIVSGCTRDPAAREALRVREILAAHLATDLDPTGVWSCSGDYRAVVLFIAPLEGVGRFSVRILSSTCTDMSETHGTGSLEAGVFTLTSPDHEFDDRHHLCRFGSRELLLPEKDVWFTRHEDPVPLGLVYTRVPSEDVGELEHLKGYLPGPEDESGPMRRVEGD